VRSTNSEEVGRDQRTLHAYHDGELGGLRRWLFERRLSRSPELRAELVELRRLTRWVQGSEPQRTSPDVWDDIALRLPAIDAQPDGRARSRSERREWRGVGWLAAYPRPVAAVAVSFALALALFLGIMEDAVPPTSGIIRWLDTGGRSVMVLEDQGDATIVWLLDAPEEGILEGGSREAV
jgi:anti-sigma factor RsiW